MYHVAVGIQGKRPRDEFVRFLEICLPVDALRLDDRKCEFRREYTEREDIVLDRKSVV